jgi:hypothetical protein
VDLGFQLAPPQCGVHCLQLLVIAVGSVLAFVLGPSTRPFARLPSQEIVSATLSPRIEQQPPDLSLSRRLSRSAAITLIATAETMRCRRNARAPASGGISGWNLMLSTLTGPNERTRCVGQVAGSALRAVQRGRALSQDSATAVRRVTC